MQLLLLTFYVLLTLFGVNLLKRICGIFIAVFNSFYLTMERKVAFG